MRKAETIVVRKCIHLPHTHTHTMHTHTHTHTTHSIRPHQTALTLTQSSLNPQHAKQATAAKFIACPASLFDNNPLPVLPRQDER